MSNETTRGYDTAFGDKDADDLNRWRIASDIVRVIQNTPPEWSTRIGVLGKWGEGKTTVVRFVERQLRDKENVVFSWEPWSKRSWEDLWSEFGDRFSAALELAKLPFDESWKKKIQKGGKWLQLPTLSKLAVKGAGFFGRDKAVKSSFDAVSSWLQCVLSASMRDGGWAWQLGSKSRLEATGNEPKRDCIHSRANRAVAAPIGGA
ncbi:MAG: hypothetical protein EXQ57_05400, partial [Bryobacterales bacterium]|nr:hypothetical protein [Bryobacterales bacterium]